MRSIESDRTLLDTESQTSEPSERVLEWIDQVSHVERRQIVCRLLTVVHPAHLITLTKRVAYCFVPQLLRSYCFDDQAPPGKEFSTSYLNGLRGLTALKVFTFHYLMVFTPATHEPWGADPRYTRFVQLPILRYAWSGFTSHVFFGLAGYLTCTRLFVIMDKNDQASQAKVLLNLSASLFRRAFRLYLPVFLITLVMATYIHYGLYEANRPLLLDWSTLFPGDWNETKPFMYATWPEQLKVWRDEMYQLFNLASSDTFYPTHDQHLWSMLSEMRASLHLTGCLVALAQCKRHVRLAIMCILVGLYLYWNHWEIWIYLLGAIVAQIDQILTHREQERETEKQALPTTILQEKNYLAVEISSPSYTSETSASSHTIDLLTCSNHPAVHRILRTLGFFLAFYLLSYPIHGSRDPAPGYEYLNLLIPEWLVRKEKFYANWGTFILLLLLVRSKPGESCWRALVSHWLPQYLGKVSFALYLVQAIVQHSFGYMLPHRIWWSFGVQGIDLESDWAWFMPIAVGWTITLIATLWAADCWTREVEGRCIRFVKWLEGKCFR